MNAAPSALKRQIPVSLFRAKHPNVSRYCWRTICKANCLSGSTGRTVPTWEISEQGSLRLHSRAMNQGQEAAFQTRLHMAFLNLHNSELITLCMCPVWCVGGSLFLGSRTTSPAANPAESMPYYLPDGSSRWCCWYQQPLFYHTGSFSFQLPPHYHHDVAISPSSTSFHP